MRSGERPATGIVTARVDGGPRGARPPLAAFAVGAPEGGIRASRRGGRSPQMPEAAGTEGGSADLPPPNPPGPR